jgi:S1-C subfamily serine protease
VLIGSLLLSAVIRLAMANEQTAAATSDSDSLCYRWKEGEEYSYRVSCKAEIGDVLLEASGITTYRVRRASEGSPPAATPELRQGSGTAFVVSADGYLLTCNHVVRGATEIKATLGGQTMPCQVVATDSAHDLAVLHVDRRGLPSLPLADSETVELAEEVRVVGYPLSDVLGSSVKITQGSVAGILAKRRGKAFQVDAMVNPGNSGGPLLNGRGAVIGVVNAQLVGQQIFKVGFAVPANYAKSLLTQHHVPFATAAAAGAKLDGPTLAKRVVPSVALVNVTCNGSTVLVPGQPSLNFHGVLDRCQRPRSTEGAVPSPIDSSERDDGELIVDEYGEISHLRSQVKLPCLLGPLGTVAIDSLPAGDEKTWQRQEMVTITVAQRGSHDLLSGIRPPGFSDPGPPPFPRGFFWGPLEREFHYPALQQISYSADEPKGTAIIIHKRLELRTMESDRASPKLELSGTGETIFDLGAGLPRKITFSGKFTMREDGQTLQVPVTLQCERATGSTLPTTTGSPAQPVASRAAPVSASATAASAATRLDGLLADLRAADKDWNKCFQALEELGLMGPIEKRRDEVAEVLNGYLAENNYSARSSALRALQTWGTRRNVPALIPLLKASERDSIRQRAIEALARLGDPRAATAIAQRAKDPSDRAAALRALHVLGRAAEDATISLLADPNPEVRDGARTILGEIGSAKSIEALKKHAEH